MNRDAICRNITEEIKRLKEKEKTLTFLPPEIRLLYGTTFSARHHISLFRP
ncbi:Hypothetical transcriptional regulator YqhC [Cronobacter sakazakii 701]|nr:Hypothetical transcriptional regulator YqhC [Cronobacter sakazakii 701]